MPTGSIAPWPRRREVDRNGDPLAGGLLYTYASGTSTPLDTFRDVDLLVPNSNPIVADAGGLFPPIYLSATSYKFVCKSASGVIQWDADPVTATHIGQSGTVGDVKFFGGDPTSPITLAAYPSGTGYDKCHAGTAIFNLDSGNLPPGTYALEGMLLGVGGATVTIGLVNLSDGSPDTAIAEIASASLTGARVRSGAITFPAAGVAKDLAIKAKASAPSGFAWALSLVKIT